MKNHSYLTILIILSIIAAISYSWFSWGVILPEAERSEGAKIYSWPDAMSNSFFIDQFIESGEFKYEEPLNILTQNVIHPRSVNVYDFDIVPISFLGMLIIYGWVGKLIGATLILFLTSILGAITPLLFYGIIWRIFNKKVAFISAILLFTLSAFVYYSNLAMLHSILFIFLIMAGLYFFIRQGEKDNLHKSYFAGLSGLFYGFALITRSVEFFWIGLLIFIPFFIYIKRIRLIWVITFLIGSIIPIGLLLFYNYQIYDSAFTLGYLNMQSDGQIFERLTEEFNVSGHSSSLINYLALIFLPFGFSAKFIYLNFNKYILDFSFPYIVLALIGFIFMIIDFAKKKLAKKQLVFIITAAAICAWISFYYGNWNFIDPLVLKYNLIGSSYVRYFLPVYIIFLPFVAYFLVRIISYKYKIYNLLKYIIVLGIIGYLSLYSYNLVYKSTYDGLFVQKETIEEYYYRANEINSLIEPNAIIITNRHDKIFWPKHRVVMFNLDYTVFPRVKEVIDRYPIYYYSLMPDVDINYINKKKIAEYDLELVEYKQIDEQFRLFRLDLTKDNK
jgi:hypothetical protein